MSIFEAFRRAMRGLALISALGIVVVAAFLGYCAYTLPLTHGPAAETPAAVVYGIGIPVSQYSTIVLRDANGTETRRNIVTTLREAGKFLQSLSEETGGRVLFANSNQDLRATFARTLSEFRDRYVLSYSPTGVSANGWHQISVKLKAKSGTVTARRGYFAE